MCAEERPRCSDVRRPPHHHTTTTTTNTTSSSSSSSCTHTPKRRNPSNNLFSSLTTRSRFHNSKRPAYAPAPSLARLSLAFSLPSLFRPLLRRPFTASSAEGRSRRSPFQPPRPECRLIGRRWRKPFTGVLEHSAGPSQASGYGLQGAGMSAYAPHLGARAFSATTGKCFVGGKKSHNTRQLVGAISNLKPHDL